MLCMMRATDNSIQDTLIENDFMSRDSILTESKILDTPPEPMFDMLASIIQHTFHTPVAAIAILGDSGEDIWIKSCIGCKETDFPSHIELCSKAIQYQNIFVLPDTDGMTKQIFSIKGNTVIYFAACPIRVRGTIIGVVFTVDYYPRTPGITERQHITMESVAKITGKNIELRILVRLTTVFIRE